MREEQLPTPWRGLRKLLPAYLAALALAIAALLSPVQADDPLAGKAIAEELDGIGLSVAAGSLAHGKLQPD